MSEVREEIEKTVKPYVHKIKQGNLEPSSLNMVDALTALFARHAEKLAIDPHDFVEPCEPDCTPERHAYHQGQWDMAGRIQKHLGYMPYPGAIDAEDKLKEPQE